MGAEFVSLSLSPLLIGALAAAACALPGNFLLLRRQALIGDAISHVVLPGIVVAFLLTGTVAAWPMMAGAGGAALVAVGLIEAIRRLGRIEAGAAMGVVFTALFALGVLLLEQSGASGVHLDVQHALYGNLESLIWLDGAAGWSALTDAEALSGLPPQLPRLGVVAIAMTLFIIAFWRALALSTFDEGFARAVGAPAGGIAIALAVATAIAAVAAFDAVGAIIVIAMFVCPPAAARLMTDRLVTQVLWSVAFALGAAIGGYLVAGYGPAVIGGRHALSAAGAIATLSGVMLAAACLWGPKRRSVGAPILRAR